MKANPNKGEKSVLAWHFCAANKRLGCVDRRKIVVGETLYVSGRPTLYEHGLHGSRRIIDASAFGFNWVSGVSYICRVRIWGCIEEQDDKLVGHYRKCLWMVPASRLVKRWYNIASLCHGGPGRRTKKGEKLLLEAAWAARREQLK